MKGHLDADVLAEYRAWLITGRRRRAIAAHLSGCAECAALDARLAQVSALLAATPAPSMPDAVARRLDDALAAEVHRPIPAERHSVPARRRAFPSWAGRSWAGVFRVRVLAPVAAAAAVLAGGGYVLSQVGGTSALSGPDSAANDNNGQAVTSGNGVSAGAASGSARSRMSPDRNNQAVPGSAVYVVTSGVNYTAATLKTQVAAQLRARPSLHATLAPTAVSACVLRITHNETPVLTEKARYQDTPATVIVLSRDGSDQVWVAGPHCSATNSDILDHVVLSPGISAP
ncbi:MAG TPA: hypothetical protein VFB06_26475 [Streptosporangiaceae bacterium]|nr:hypothetical protein [Streptosporangiaceae bacterium]